MLAALKDMLHGVLPWTLYLAVLGTVCYSAVKRSHWALLLLIVLIPQPNVWYKIQEFPLGQSTMDLLLFGALLGIFINSGGYDRSPRGALIVTFLFMVYAALWNSSLRFGLGLPITTGNRLIPDFKNYVEMLLLYFVAYNSIKTEEGQKVAVVLMSIITLMIGVREIRNFDAGASFSYDKRAQGPFWMVGLGANHFGAYIAYVGAFLVGLLLVDKNFRRKVLYGTTIGCLVYPLFTTYSRGAYAAALGALAVFGVIRKRAILVGLVVLAVTWTTVLPPAVVERISMTAAPDGQIEESAALRLVLWERAKELFAQNPVFGIGYEGFAVSVRIAGLNNTHNFYMQTAAEQGVIGLLFLAMLFMFATASGWRLYRVGRSDFHKGMGLGFIGSVAAVAIGNVFGDRWSYFALGAYFWIMWGLVDRATTLSLAPSAAPAPAPAVQEPQGVAPAETGA